MFNFFPATDRDQTLNTPSPINIPPTTSSSASLFKSVKITIPDSGLRFTTDIEGSTEAIAFTPTTTIDLTNENYTFNSLQRTELPTDPMPPYYSGLSDNENLINESATTDFVDRGRITIRNWDGKGPHFIKIKLPENFTLDNPVAKQIPAITIDPLKPVTAATDVIVSNNPCTCDKGLCSCCTGKNYYYRTLPQNMKICT